MLQNEVNVSRFFRMCEARRHVEHPRRNVLAHAFRTLRPGGASDAPAATWHEFLGLMSRALVEPSAVVTSRAMLAPPSRVPRSGVQRYSSFKRRPRANIMAQYDTGASPRQQRGGQVKLVRRFRACEAGGTSPSFATPLRRACPTRLCLPCTLALVLQNPVASARGASLVPGSKSSGPKQLVQLACKRTMDAVRASYRAAEARAAHVANAKHGEGQNGAPSVALALSMVPPDDTGASTCSQPRTLASFTSRQAATLDLSRWAWIPGCVPLCTVGHVRTPPSS